MIFVRAIAKKNDQEVRTTPLISHTQSALILQRSQFTLMWLEVIFVKTYYTVFWAV